MTITLYLYTSRTDAFRFGPEDLEEEESIKLHGSESSLIRCFMIGQECITTQYR